jgi:hypothetical protein
VVEHLDKYAITAEHLLVEGQPVPGIGNQRDQMLMVAG